MPINGFLYPAPSTPTFPYQVANSLRFNDGSSEQLSIVTSAGSDYKATFSAWVKKTTIGVESFLLYAYYNSNNKHVLNFYQDQIYINLIVGASTAATVITNRLFRDPSAWMHIVVAWDTTQSTASDRIKVYVNGVQETSFGTANYPDQNTNIQFNRNTNGNYVGGQAGSNTFDGYMSEVVYIDGSALDPTSFGEFDSDSPTIWKPKDVSGLTFGTNGFYLEFKQSGTSQNSSGLGADTSGNDNHLAVSNLTAVDQSTDTCTNNFATLNPLTFSEGTLSEGNLEIDHNGSAGKFCASTFEVSQGKWYFEAKLLNYSSSSRPAIGLAQSHNSFKGGIYANTNYALFLPESGAYESNSANSVSGISISPASNDIFMFAIDLDNLKFYAGKNGSWFSSQDPSAGSNGYTIAVSDSYAIATAANDTSSNSGRNNDWQFNFGSPMYSITSSNQDPNGYGSFEYSTEGFYTLNSKNLAEFG